MADLGTYHFLPWLRRGIGAALQPAAGPLPARAKLDVQLAVDATLNGVVTTDSPPGLSVHVYGPALKTMTRYQFDGDRLRIASIDRAGVQW